MPSANSLTSISQNLGRVAGPAVGAALVAAVGPAAAFALNGLSLVVSPVLLTPLLWAGLRRPQHGGGTMKALRDLRQGFATVLASPWLSISILIFG